jgi:5-methylcytosine-specific restriction endonuclease McrA
MDADSRREQLALAQYTRNAKWDQVRRKFLKLNNECAVCGGRRRLVAHHVKPYQWWPELELDTDNLITLCGEHHLLVGHLGRWASYNIHVREDAKIWRAKIKNRPKWRQK